MNNDNILLKRLSFRMIVFSISSLGLQTRAMKRKRYEVTDKIVENPPKNVTANKKPKCRRTKNLTLKEKIRKDNEFMTSPTMNL